MERKTLYQHTPVQGECGCGNYPVEIGDNHPVRCTSCGATCRKEGSEWIERFDPPEWVKGHGYDFKYTDAKGCSYYAMVGKEKLLVTSAVWGWQVREHVPWSPQEGALGDYVFEIGRWVEFLSEAVRARRGNWEAYNAMRR